MNIAIIPARGGSKRIPRKNIKDFHGKPMIAYSIEAALISGCFDEVCVSTDDNEIAEVALRYGATIPFIRPAGLADDYASTQDVMTHALNWYKQNNRGITHVCCIYATAPFITPEALQNGLSALKSDDLDYAFSATSYSFPIQRAIKLTEQGTVEMFQPEHLSTRSQDLEEAYHDAGQFYWGTAPAFINRKPFFSSRAKAILLPRKYVQDIDTQEDWELAEALFKALK
ncbi:MULTISPECIES: pseudaminic acid cytidylyltransferase [Pseudoalteromonas]|uniref:N-acylneuraminate cytidylyltransferase n=1 Tax=Pseudoalteromonas agarivorans DSM 14585 TaxID=1312369 RepID=A0ACA8DUN6_9GAMM|nr:MULTISPECIES: pseudaminic acid cytidylyltransferase [Pseudoalteromonas]ATC81553.1 N-acylneuraminate cytidylyltransferase [Pseudoalteromonas agarivorans DSM 14585]MCK8133050.1 pseudaminic acid cytidylyltransferase [Pseudoalteromonas sp. 2CM28B]